MYLYVYTFALDCGVWYGMVWRNYNKISEDEVETFSWLKEKNVSCVGKGFLRFLPKRLL